MKVSDVMTQDVISVALGASIKEVARLLVEHGISGMPVVDDGRVVGVVSETDVLYKERGTRRPTLLARLLDPVEAEERLKASAGTAAEAMTSPAETIASGMSVSHAAELMIEYDVNRLPVIDSGRLVGIVTRADLVRAFARSDDELERELREDLRFAWSTPDAVGVDVAGGYVTLHGPVDSKRTADAIAARAARMPGVVAVESQLTWSGDGGSRLRPRGRE